MLEENNNYLKGYYFLKKNGNRKSKRIIDSQ